MVPVLALRKSEELQIQLHVFSSFYRKQIQKQLIKSQCLMRTKVDSVGKEDSSLCAWRTEINMCSLPPKPVVAQSVIHTCLTGTHTELILSLHTIQYLMINNHIISISPAMMTTENTAVICCSQESITISSCWELAVTHRIQGGEATAQVKAQEPAPTHSPRQ